jgi:hypothetical protein
MPDLLGSKDCSTHKVSLKLNWQFTLGMTSTRRPLTKNLPMLALRKPKRITITVPQAVYERLEQLSYEDGRSLSNLAAFLLERGIGKEI